jgi:hypothetical protein
VRYCEGALSWGCVGSAGGDAMRNGDHLVAAILMKLGDQKNNKIELVK